MSDREADVEDAWERMVEEEMEARKQTPHSVYEDALSGSDITTSESSSSDDDSSDEDDESWAPRQPRPIPVSLHFVDDAAGLGPEDAEEAVRQAGLGLASLDLSSHHLPPRQISIKPEAPSRPRTLLLPSNWERLCKEQLVTRFVGSGVPYEVVGTFGLFPTAAEMKDSCRVDGLDDLNAEALIGRSLSAVFPPLVKDGVIGEDVSMPYPMLVCLLSGHHGNDGRQAWVLSKNGDSLTVLHDEPSDINYAMHLCLYHGLPSELRRDVTLSIGGTFVRISGMPAVVLDPFSPVSDLYDGVQGAMTVEVDPFGLSVKRLIPHGVRQREPFQDGRFMLHHIMNQIACYKEPVVLLHRSEEHLVFALRPAAGVMEELEEGETCPVRDDLVDVAAELPPSVHSVKDLTQ